MEALKKDKVQSTSEESKELASIALAFPQAKRKKAYYEGIMLANEELYNSIQKRIKKGGTITKAFIFGFIPVITKHKLDDTDISRLNVELQEIENKIYSQQQYYEHWLKAVKDYETRMDGVTRECNQQFDEVLKKAKEIKQNMRLQEGIANYKNEDNDQQLKNEYYLYLKQEVNNHEVHKGKKGKR
jgi:hypothetical protein